MCSSSINGLSKTFGSTTVLHDVDLEVRAGEVHALVGQNGSGKSTLIKVLSGYHRPDPSAQITVDDVPLETAGFAGGGQRTSPHLSFVHQDLGLVLELNTIENLALRGGFSRTRFGRVRWAEQTRNARRLIRSFGLDLDVTEPLSNVTPSERTVVAIAAAMQGWNSSGGILVLDEPTAVMPPNEVARLLAMVQRIRASGAGVLYVSHRLDEIFEVCDRVTILRDGHKVACRDVRDLSKRELVHLMLGEEIDPDFRAAPSVHESLTPLLEVKDLQGRYLRGVSFTQHKGEVLGVAGLPDSGRDELPRLLTDQRRNATHGSIRSEHTKGWVDVSRWKTSDIALLPPDRAQEGIVGPFTIGENLSLSVLDRLGTPFRLRKRNEARFVAEWMEKVSVVGGQSTSGITTLSGGNQQKVVFGRALARDPAMLVLCEPTAGVDIGTRHAIYELIGEQARQGLSVLVTSSDLGDLTSICNRVLVLHKGRVASELRGDAITEHRLVHAMEGLETASA